MDPKNPQKNERSLLLALLLLTGAVVLIFSYIATDDKNLKEHVSGTEPVFKSDKYEKSVNRHLMLTNEKMKLEHQRAKLESARLLNNDFNKSSAQQPFMNENKLDLSSENRAAEVAKEIGRDRDRKEEVISPDDIVQKDLFNEQQMQEYTQAYRAEYARQFVENARRGGYNVILSEDLTRIISVTPLRAPSQNFNLDLSPGASSVR